MIRLIPLAVIAAVLAACSTPREAPAPRIVTIEHTYMPGTGVIQSVMPTPVMAGAGSSSPESLQRLEIRMDNGRTQYIDTASTGLAKGDRIQLGEDRVIRKL